MSRSPALAGILALMVGAAALPRVGGAAVNWAKPLRVDVGLSTGRKDTATPGWQEWQVVDGVAATQEIGGIRFTLRAKADASAADAASVPLLKGVWNKAGLARGATMATDGVVATSAAAAPSTLELQIEGLPAGPQSIVTYHNLIDDAEVAPYLITVEGVAAATSVAPSRRAADNLGVASAHVEFVAQADRPTIVRIAPQQGASSSAVILNGFELGAVDPTRKAVAPVPADNDEHVDADGGALDLAWRAPASAVKHEVYFASAATAAAAFDAIASATSGDESHLATVDGTSAPVEIDPRQTLRHYAWRVDAVDADGHVTQGDVWQFRPRRLAFPNAEGYEIGRAHV